IHIGGQVLRYLQCDGAVAALQPPTRGQRRSTCRASIQASIARLDIPVTTTGKIRENEVHGKLNGGGNLLVIHTGDGSIRLRKA
ncbi:MAG: hypothetical protein WCB59_15740, partial [Candidatus Sulfotelmatobacter sp.]